MLTFALLRAGQDWQRLRTMALTSSPISELIHPRKIMTEAKLTVYYYYKLVNECSVLHYSDLGKTGKAYELCLPQAHQLAKLFTPAKP